MECKIVKSVLLMSVFILLIRDVRLLNCPSYPKHELMNGGFLYDEAICRAEMYDFEEKICMNGLKPSFYYCSTGSCNVFGFNCDGRCLAGYDNTPEGLDFSLKCTTTVMRERVKLCQFYNDRYEKISNDTAPLDKNHRKRVLPIETLITEIVNFVMPRNIQGVKDNLKHVCPRAKYEKSLL